tara:strand:- start:46 stop:309 length:264 start_codon:yes stop_codon:yes gene_type:complete
MTVYEFRPETPKEGDIHVYSNRGRFYWAAGNPDVMLCEGNIAAEIYQNDRWNNIKRIKINTRYLDPQGERETLDHIITYFEGKLHER